MCCSRANRTRTMHWHCPTPEGCQFEPVRAIKCYPSSIRGRKTDAKRLKSTEIEPLKSFFSNFFDDFSCFFFGKHQFRLTFTQVGAAPCPGPHCKTLPRAPDPFPGWRHWRRRCWYGFQRSGDVHMQAQRAIHLKKSPIF